MKRPRRTDSPSVTERLIEHDWSVMLYDGNCNFCSSCVRFVAENSRERLLAFSAMQSAAGQAALANAQKLHGDLDSSLSAPSANMASEPASGPAAHHEAILVLTSTGALRRGDAVLHLLSFMSGPWPTVARILKFLPRGVKTALYDLITNNRRRIMGRSDDCMIDVSDLERRFVR
jgi:predicted DCC family thiol-disulfide oxidoreductase YuxK